MRLLEQRLSTPNTAPAPEGWHAARIPLRRSFTATSQSWGCLSGRVLALSRADLASSVRMPYPNEALRIVAEQMENFEAGASVANTGTGSRREGQGFERLVASFWMLFANHLRDAGAREVERARGPRGKVWLGLEVDSRTAWIPVEEDPTATHTVPSDWLALDFKVQDLVAAYPGTEDAVREYAPDSGPYAGDAYPSMFSSLKTKFDDTIVLEDTDTLFEKVLLEYKTAKSSKGRQIDGNAHERLSFQVMQYLEVATRFPSCSLVVMANGAFARYRNKYHVNFHVQAQRLTAFRWFQMEHLCLASEYARLTARIESWLLHGAGGRR
jgi:hypothetical protein